VSNERASGELLLIGHTGQVGGALLKLLARQPLGFSIRALAHRAGVYWFREAVHPAEVKLDELLPGSAWLDRRGIDFLTLDAATARLAAVARAAVIVDCTASADIPRRYPKWLTAGIGVVTPNKIGFAGAQADFELLQRLALRHGAPLEHEGTVGAALPVLNTVADQLRAGAPLTTIEATLSGTLGYVLDQLQQGVRFSSAVERARDAGYTEPDPWVDLSGEDVARKLLILARVGGHALEPTALTRKPLAVPGLPAVDGLAPHFSDHDGPLQAAAERAARRGERLAYVARYMDGRALVGLESLPLDHPLVQAKGPDNVIVLSSEIYPDQPLVIRGPGAGVNATASAVHADLHRASLKLAARCPGVRSVAA
jgi:aspartokinase/homoserine dehydrogenase 1